MFTARLFALPIDRIVRFVGSGFSEKQFSFAQRTEGYGASGVGAFPQHAGDRPIFSLKSSAREGGLDSARGVPNVLLY